ncbi:MAG: hypothetical protein C5B50_28825 [Verrucomicrobia bacterium]|nr:MAG: hypothetical protein C5B50_28825 [Verrucomicrobiota bacterium]
MLSAPYFGITAEVTREHVIDSGQKLDFSRTIHLDIKRPNRLHAEMESEHAQRGYWYDGKLLTVLDRKRNLFSSTSLSGTLDDALDNARDQFGIDLPLIDLAISDPFKNAMANVKSGAYYGVSPVMGYHCHHLAFSQDNVDWQVWIEDGPQPLIRKFVITHKLEEGQPTFTALITQWTSASGLRIRILCSRRHEGRSRSRCERNKLRLRKGEQRRGVRTLQRLRGLKR